MRSRRGACSTSASSRPARPTSRTTASAFPNDAKGPLTFTAKLQYRKFSHAYTQFAYAGQPASGEPVSAAGQGFDDRAFSFDPANIPANVSGQIKDRIPDLPIVTLADSHGSGAGEQRTPPTEWRTVADQAKPRAVERLGHRAAPAGRPQGRGVRVHAGDDRPNPSMRTAG